MKVTPYQDEDELPILCSKCRFEFSGWLNGSERGQQVWETRISQQQGDHINMPSWYGGKLKAISRVKCFLFLSVLFWVLWLSWPEFLNRNILRTSHSLYNTRLVSIPMASLASLKRKRKTTLQWWQLFKS